MARFPLDPRRLVLLLLRGSIVKCNMMRQIETLKYADNHGFNLLCSDHTLRYFSHALIVALEQWKLLNFLMLFHSYLLHVIIVQENLNQKMCTFWENQSGCSQCPTCWYFDYFLLGRDWGIRNVTSNKNKEGKEKTFWWLRFPLSFHFVVKSILVNNTGNAARFEMNQI